MPVEYLMMMMAPTSSLEDSGYTQLCPGTAKPDKHIYIVGPDGWKTSPASILGDGDMAAELI